MLSTVAQGAYLKLNPLFDGSHGTAPDAVNSPHKVFTFILIHYVIGVVGLTLTLSAPLAKILYVAC